MKITIFESSPILNNLIISDQIDEMEIPNDLILKSFKFSVLFSKKAYIENNLDKFIFSSST